MYKKVLAGIICVFCYGLSTGQNLLNYEADQLIVKFHEGYDFIPEIRFDSRQTELVSIHYQKTLFGDENVHLYQINTNGEIDLEQFSNEFNHKAIEWTSPDYKVEKRISPNDEFFNEQWEMEVIQAVEAWDITTGGTTINGDTIVVAIIDAGFFLEHEDLVDNIWYSKSEISDDGIDNDNNGFIDDYVGWNFIDDSNEHRFDSHGPPVAGIIGAKGNNGVGVTGVNWDVKYMLISGLSLVSHVIESYQYIKTQREAYDQSNGQRGAYIVVSNLSGGVPNTFPEDGAAFQLWCSLYDELGQIGVLNVASTANDNINVDVEGDIPSTCPSPYLLTVTNTTQLDEKASTAAFGPIHIDIGAPGASLYTVGPEGTDHYRTFPGTSASSPLVAGTVALLYSAPCQEFLDLYQSNPASGALAMKDIILLGSDPVSALDGITVSGKRLNVFGGMEQLREYCEGTSGTLKLINIFPNPIRGGNLIIRYQTPDFGDYTIDIFNAMGQRVFTEKFNPPFFGDDKTIVIESDSNWDPGIYFLMLQSDSDKVSTSFMVF